MKTMCKTGSSRAIMALVLFSLILSTNLDAHDYTNLNEYQIDRANDSISDSILQLQLFLGDIFRQNHVSDKWPDTKLLLLRDDLLHQREEAELGQEYFLATGLNIQSPDVMLKNPLIGRTVVSGQVIDTAFALIKYINSLESQDAFIKEVYAGGQASIMYNLLAAQREKMDLYRSLFIALQLPATGGTNTASMPAPQTAVVPLLLYLFGILGLCALVSMMLRPDQSGSTPG